MISNREAWSIGPGSSMELPQDRPEKRLGLGNKTGVRGKRATHPKSTQSVI